MNVQYLPLKHSRKVNTCVKCKYSKSKWSEFHHCQSQWVKAYETAETSIGREMGFQCVPASKVSLLLTFTAPVPEGGK